MLPKAESCRRAGAASNRNRLYSACFFVFLTLGLFICYSFVLPSKLVCPESYGLIAQQLSRLSAYWKFDEQVSDVELKKLFNISQSIFTTSAKYSQCQNLTKWSDDIELLLPMPPTDKGLQEFSSYLLPSLALFWPKSRSNLLVLTDAEAGERLPIFKEKLLKLAGDQVGRLRIVTSSAAFPCSGWDRQQWLMLWADNFTNSEYVGFIDTDTVFVTRVTRNDLFVDNRPIVRAVYGKPMNDFWSQLPATTEWVIGRKEPFKCMSYFPVIIKVEHLKFVREHIRQHLDSATFDESFVQIMARAGKHYGQFNFMCAYLWYHHRNEYNWIINEAEPGWVDYVPGQIDNPADGEIDDELMKRPTPHLAVHWTYEFFRHLPGAVASVLAIGVCYSLTVAETAASPSFCSFINRSEINIIEWQFEGIDYSNRPGVTEAHAARLLKHSHCPHEWNLNALRSLFKIEDLPVSRLCAYQSSNGHHQSSFDDDKWLVVIILLATFVICLATFTVIVYRPRYTAKSALPFLEKNNQKCYDFIK